jgi:hypothetical protein
MLLLVDHREGLVQERTRIISRLRWHLHELDLDGEPAARTLNRARSLARLAARLEGSEGTVARLARDLVDRCRSLTIEIRQLEREISELVETLAPASGGRLLLSKRRRAQPGPERQRSARVGLRYGHDAHRRRRGRPRRSSSRRRSHHVRHGRARGLTGFQARDRSSKAPKSSPSLPTMVVVAERTREAADVLRRIFGGCQAR